MPAIRSRLILADKDISSMSIDELHDLAGRFKEYEAELKARISRHEIRLREVNRKLKKEMSERVLAENRLERSERYFRALVENALDIIIVMDRDGTIRYGSPALNKVLGYTLEEVIGASIFAYIHPDNLADAKKMFLECQLDPDFVTRVEYRLKHKDGDWRYVEIVGQNALNNPAVEGFILNLRDITRRKMSQEALRDISEFNASLLENSPNPIMVHNPDTAIRYVNPAFVSTTGYSYREIAGAKAPYPWWPKEKQREFMRILLRGFKKHLHGMEGYFYRKNRTTIWVVMNLMPVFRQGEVQYLVSSWNDITRQKQLAEELEYYAREITQAQEEEKKRIARELHDDTAQALAMLSLEIDSIIKADKNLPEKALEKLKQLREDVDRTMQEVRRFSHELRPGVLDNLGLQAALETLVDDFNEKNQIEADIQVLGSPRNLPPDIELALFRLAQEALSNVRKHSQAERALVKIRYSNRRVKLVISDDGQGFNLKRELEFARAGKLGLIGMKERAHLIGAELKINSRPHRGTTVMVEKAI